MKPREIKRLLKWANKIKHRFIREWEFENAADMFSLVYLVRSLLRSPEKAKRGRS